MQLGFQDFAQRAVSPFLELGAYEALWDEPNTSFKSLADRFAKRADTLPSDFVERSTALRYANDVHTRLKAAGITNYGVRVHGAGDYPTRLRDAEYPVELLYYQGWWELVNSPRSIAVVGTRSPSEEGLRRVRKIVTSLVKDDFTIVSGLAAGIDTEAHSTAIEVGGRTIAVLGTPLSKAYPKTNSNLQKEIAKDHLVVSQVPVKRYWNQPKTRAISQVAGMFSKNLGADLGKITLVPVPPSKMKGDPEYDDRLMSMLKLVKGPGNSKLMYVS